MRKEILGALLLLCAVLLGALSTTRLVEGIDTSVLTWLAQHRSETLTTAMLALTNLFTPVSVVVFAFLAALIAWWVTSERRAGLYIVAAVGGASIFTQVAKLVFQRPRPQVALQVLPEVDFSFPSGHVTGIVALCTALVVLLARHQGRGVARAGAVCAVLIAGACALARVYLGAHWPSDVLGGALVGIGACLIAEPLLNALSTVRGRTPAEPHAAPSQNVGNAPARVR